MILERWLQLLGALLAATLVRGMAVFLGALAATTLARRLGSETRHLIWLGVILSFVLIPMAWLLLPPIRIGAEIRLAPVAALRLAAAPALSGGEYARLLAPAAAVHATPSLAVTAAIALSMVCAWFAGVLALLTRLAVGQCKLLRLASGAGGDERLQAAADTLCGQLAVGRRIPVLLSPLCHIPFACGIMRPRILLPQNAAQWPQGRLQSALVHELAHIRRRDLAVQTACYTVCVLFWFVPPLWLAYAAMLREAETCCDQQVINRGFRAPEYARDIVELARSCRGRILLPSISSAIGKKSLLKERIRRVLELQPGRRPFGTTGVLKVLTVCLACAAPVLALSAQARPAEEPLFGTWVNERFGTGKGCPQKMVLFSDGRELDYMMMGDQEPFWECKFWILGKSTDAEGNCWYKLRWNAWYYGAPPELADESLNCGSEGYSLIRISASGTAIECVTAESRIPDEEDWNLIPHPAFRRES